MRPLTVTARSDLRKGSGANTHFAIDPSVYTQATVPNPVVVQAIIDLNIGYVRERWRANTVAQQSAFTTLTQAGVGLYLFIGSINYPLELFPADVAALAEAPFADSVIAICGPNEPNADGGDTWPDLVVAMQEAIYTEVFNHPDFARHVAIVGPALKHEVNDLDHDYQALANAGIGRWCTAGDFHFYPGNGGPWRNAAEITRARQAYGDLPLWHGETGWTGADTAPDVAGKFTIEALLRNHLSGLVGTVLYEVADEAEFLPGREGLFGLMTATDPKPAYTRIQKLIAAQDGYEPINAWLDDYATGVESDTGVVVTSEGNRSWTIYLLRESQDTATIHWISDQAKDYQITVPLTESLMVITVAERGDLIVTPQEQEVYV
jgi:hypothetical protein